MKRDKPCIMRPIVWIIVIVLGVIHQDFWYWDDRTLVWGFMPIGLAYHALYSILAGGAWALAVIYVWPKHWEDWADEDEGEEGETTSS